jgi:protease YdgD
MATAAKSGLPQFVKLALAAGMVALLQACAASQQKPAPVEPSTPPKVEAESLGGRMLADAQEYPWSALGRVNLAGQGFCTGILIGPQHVLTGAGCLYASRENRWYRPQELHFIAAYQKDRFLADSAIADFTVAQGFNPQAGTSLANITSNWAIVALQKPIGRQTGWLGLEWDSPRLQEAAEGNSVAYLRAGYRTDWPHAVSLHFGCDEGDGGLVQLCSPTPTERVLPFFVAEGGELRVLADFYAATPSQGDALATLTGNTAGGGRLGRSQPPAGSSQVGRQPTATAAQLLVSLGYDVSGGDIGGAAAAFRRDQGLPASEAVDIALLTALISAAQSGGR